MRPGNAHTGILAMADGGRRHVALGWPGHGATSDTDASHTTVNSFVLTAPEAGPARFRRPPPMAGDASSYTALQTEHTVYADIARASLRSSEAEPSHISRPHSPAPSAGAAAHFAPRRSWLLWVLPCLTAIVAIAALALALGKRGSSGSCACGPLANKDASAQVDWAAQTASLRETVSRHAAVLAALLAKGRCVIATAGANTTWPLNLDLARTAVQNRRRRISR